MIKKFRNFVKFEFYMDNLMEYATEMYFSPINRILTSFHWTQHLRRIVRPVRAVFISPIRASRRMYRVSNFPNHSRRLSLLTRPSFDRTWLICAPTSESIEIIMVKYVKSGWCWLKGHLFHFGIGIGWCLSFCRLLQIWTFVFQYKMSRCAWM